MEDDIADWGCLQNQQQRSAHLRNSTQLTRPRRTWDKDNEYNVVVQASDRGKMDQHNWFKVTVTVVNVDETGEVTWTVDPDGALPDGG